MADLPQSRLLTIAFVFATLVLSACGGGAASRQPSASTPRLTATPSVHPSARPSVQPSMGVTPAGVHVSDSAERLDTETRDALEDALSGLLQRGGPDVILYLAYGPDATEQENLHRAQEALYAFELSAREPYRMVILVSLDRTLDHGVISWAADEAALEGVTHDEVQGLFDTLFTPLARAGEIEQALLDLVDGLKVLIPSCAPAASAEPPIDLSACRSVGFSHHAPDLESALPATIDGRPMTRWSLAGWCLVSWVVSDDAEFAEFSQTLIDEGVDVEGISYALAGRSDVENHPPYFVHVAGWRGGEVEAEIAVFLTFGAAGFLDPLAYATGTFEYREVGGKLVDVASPDQMVQGEHQQGSAYVYLPEGADRVFVVVTDDEAWAADALSQLP